MNVTFALIVSLLAGLSTTLGTLFIFIPINKEKQDFYISLFISISISIMISLSIIELIPNAIISINDLYIHSLFIIFLIILVSYIFIKVVNYVLSRYDNDLYRIGIISMIVLMIHNFPEGIITFLGSSLDQKLGIKLAISIALHNIPEGIIIAMPIYFATKSKAKAFFKTLLSGLAEPLGAIITYLFLYKYIQRSRMHLMLLFVGCIMIIIAINDLLPEAKKHGNNKTIMIGFFIGIFIVSISLLF